MNEISPFIFKSSKVIAADAFYACLDRSIYKKEQLLEALYELLCFPGYFGFNWDALNDCLNDLSWIRERRIVLEHAELPNIPEFELKIYLEILRDAVISWEADGEHHFEVVFRELDRNRVIALLAA
jgi:RNAse (barnase) inhibitor barstar